MRGGEGEEDRREKRSKERDRNKTFKRKPASNLASHEKAWVQLPHKRNKHGRFQHI